METNSCLSAFGIVTYIILSFGIIQWFSEAVAQVESYNLNTPIVWNLGVASVSLLAWLNMPFMCAASSKPRLFRVLKFVHFVLTGPVLLTASMLGLYWNAIEYQDSCSTVCSSVLKYLHWFVLFFVSLITFLWVFSHKESSDNVEVKMMSFLPLESSTLEVEWDRECAICLEKLRTGELVGNIRKCRHCFHKKCIDDWIAVNNKCPLCRSIV